MVGSRVLFCFFFNNSVSSWIKHNIHGNSRILVEWRKVQKCGCESKCASGDSCHCFHFLPALWRCPDLGLRGLITSGLLVFFRKYREFGSTSISFTTLLKLFSTSFIFSSCIDYLFLYRAMYILEALVPCVVFKTRKESFGMLFQSTV